jgi:hypothetical protein
LGGGREEVLVVAVDGVSDGFAPAVVAEGVGVFLLGDVDGLQESLHQVGDGVSGFGFHIAADNGGDETCQGGAEIAGGEVVAGEEVGQVFAERFCGAGAGFFLGVVEAEVGMVAVARSTATAAIQNVKEHKDTRSFVFREDIKVSLELSFGIADGKSRAEARRLQQRGRNAGKMPVVQNRNAPAEAGAQ